ncbi:MAG: DNA polymerase III subunit beta [Oligoflexales bacterium]
MKTKELKQAITILKAGACHRVIQPILANVALNGKMVTTDLDCWTIVEMPTGINTTASIFQLDKLLKNVKTDEVAFSQDGHHLKVVAGSLKTTLKGMPVDEYPAVPSLDVKLALTLDGKRFLSAIKKLAYSVGDESQNILAGICLKVNKTGLEMASTDGSRLGKYTDPAITSDEPFEAVIPGQYLAAFHKSMQGNKDDHTIRLEIAPDLASLRMGKVHFIIRTLDGFYPVYNQLIPNPSDAKHRLTFEKVDLEKAINQIKTFANPRTNVIRFEFEQGTLTLKTSTPDIGESEIALPYRASCQDGALTTAFNYAYILDALKVIESDTVQLSMSEPLHPAILIGQDDPHYLALVMPVQVK